MKYKQILQASKNKISDKEASAIFDKLLNKTTAKRESNKAEAQHLVLAYLFTNGLLENGYIPDLSVNKISKDLGISKGPVNSVLGVFGYKYERDRITPKQDVGSNGLVDRYFQFTYTEDKRGKGIIRYSRSVFTLVVNEKLYDKFDELGITEYNRLSSDELKELHTRIKNGSYNKKTIIENPEDMPIVFKETEINYNEEGFDTEVHYHGLQEVIDWANSKLSGDSESPDKLDNLTDGVTNSDRSLIGSDRTDQNVQAIDIHFGEVQNLSKTNKEDIVDFVDDKGVSNTSVEMTATGSCGQNIQATPNTNNKININKRRRILN